MEPPHPFAQFVVGNDERRQQAHDGVAGRNGQKAMISSEGREARGGNLELESDHEAFAANLLDHPRVAILELGELLARQQPQPGDVFDEARRQHDVEHGVADRHRERIAAERRAMRRRR